MKKLITILFLLISANCFCQKYIGHWNRTGSKIDSVQQSIDGIYFKTIKTVFGGIDSNELPGATYFYRIRTINNVSNSVFVYSLLPISITNFYLQTNPYNVVMGWTSQSEEGGGYYRISKTYNGAHFIVIATVADKGNSNYKITIKK